MKKLQQFTIWTTNQFGIGCFKIKAKNFDDAFLRLGKKDKSKSSGWIEDENGDSKTFSEILGLELI